MRSITLAVCFALAACGPGGGALDRLARRGEVQRDATMVAEAEVTVSAPPQAVWAVLADVDHWPRWWAEVSRARLEGPLAAGTPFDWTKGTTIRSRLALVEPDRRLAWSGHSWLVRAIHVWELVPLPDGRTRVVSRESLDGWFIRWIFPRGALQGNLQAALEGLKREAEGKPPG